MKDVIRLTLMGAAICGLFALTVLAFGGQHHAASTLTTEEISWVEFCKARNYDPHTEDKEIINEDLDTWVGSVEEEQAFNHLPAQEV